MKQNLVAELMRLGIAAAQVETDCLQLKGQEASVNGMIKVAHLGHFDENLLEALANEVRLEQMLIHQLEELASKIRRCSFTAASKIVEWCIDRTIFDDEAMEEMDSEALKAPREWVLTERSASRGMELMRRTCLLSKDQHRLGVILDALCDSSLTEHTDEVAEAIEPVRGE